MSLPCNGAGSNQTTIQVNSRSLSRTKSSKSFVRSLPDSKIHRSLSRRRSTTSTVGLRVTPLLVRLLKRLELQPRAAWLKSVTRLPWQKTVNRFVQWSSPVSRMVRSNFPSPTTLVQRLSVPTRPKSSSASTLDRRRQLQVHLPQLLPPSFLPPDA